MKPINLNEKLNMISDHWHPHIIGALNGQYVKLVKLKGDFIWHSHEAEDELFYVLSGILTMEFRDKVVELKPGEMVIVPKGVEHRPRATEEVSVLLFEPQTTLNTGEHHHEYTKEKLDWI